MNIFSENMNGKTPDSQTVIIKDTRISVIAPRLIRIEKQPDLIFCDMPTQSVFNRDFGKTDFVVTDNNANFAVKTDEASFIFNKNCELIEVVMKNGMRTSDFYSGNLKGTKRTLDMTSGAVKLEDGILSKDGVAIMNDSKSLIITEDDDVLPRDEYLNRKSGGTDIYVFAYGHDYKSAIRDFYRLTGPTPLIPRFTLGNWWSRYKAYTQEEYLSLMQRFIDEEIPISVATVDMDWHWVDVADRFGRGSVPDRRSLGLKGMLSTVFQNSGWTGYSWNTELFPDYKAFLKKLQNDNFKVTVNLHPADGVRFFEDMYEEFAEFMGIDPKTKQTIPFDLTDKKFKEGYFKYLHNGYEEDGVDFWWIDWQQGTNSKVKGLDPLWILNHYHSEDIARNGKRPLILSRYAGLGSHRYPLGFSGDTTVCWPVLDFQPYFTANASNCGYSWWSHDIGGHHMGGRNDELYIRWLQFGVFSPIMRLHSTKNEFLGKEPWKFSKNAENEAVACLRFRHRLIPYLYTMNKLTHFEGRPLIEPMYYENPENEEAYNVPNEYYFGTELIAAPITKKISKLTNLASADVWLPEGRYTDIFTGRIYNGNQKIKMFRDTSSIPVLAKEGAIIPLDTNDRTNRTENPEDMELYIYRGNNEFTLYEDDGETMNYKKGEFAQTTFAVSEKANDVVFAIAPVEGDLSIIPEKRKYILSFKDVADCEKVTVTVNGRRCSAETIKTVSNISVIVELTPTDKLRVSLKNITAKKNPPRKEMLIDFLSKVQCGNNEKEALFGSYLKDDFDGNAKTVKDIRDPIKEIFAMTQDL